VQYAPETPETEFKIAAEEMPAPRGGTLKEEATAYVEEHRIRAYEADPNQRTTIVTMSNLLQVMPTDSVQVVRLPLVVPGVVTPLVCSRELRLPAALLVRSPILFTKAGIVESATEAMKARSHKRCKPAQNRLIAIHLYPPDWRAQAIAIPRPFIAHQCTSFACTSLVF